MLVMQLLGFQAYLLFNTMGCPRDPPGTNVRHKSFALNLEVNSVIQHFLPSSVLFKKKEHSKIVASNLGLILVSSALVQYNLKHGFAALMKHYVVPYIVRRPSLHSHFY
jgi:omega-6 fatty acid desaturase (delta-12 desaturase)